jgi:hypothetical protein
MVMGLRAEGENWLGGYSSVTRRFLRLAHVAFIALSIINILYGKEIASVNLDDTLKNIGSALMIFGAVGVSIGCISAAFIRKTKYFLPLAATSLLIGGIILVVGLVQS